MSISSSSSNNSPQTYEPVVPVDLIRASYHSAMGPQPQHTTREIRSSSDTGESLKSPRTARFAEATTIHSRVEQTCHSPFAEPPKNAPSGGVGDVGFGYVNDPAHAGDSMPPASPLRSGLRVPNTARSLNPLSPTFREEYMLEKQEKYAEKENARDLRIKVRVRIAKVFLRFVNFGCSLIVLSILAVTLTVFNATKNLPTRSNAPAWAPGTNPWAQYMLLAMACVSLFACLIVFWAYWKGGHRRAEKTAFYYTAFSIGFFFVSLIMWVVGAAIYKSSRANGGGQDMWGWACNQNTREQFFQNAVDYQLLCRLQDWGLVCAAIEIVVEVLVLIIYIVVFYRFWTKRRLMKSMNRRDKARNDLYLAQLHVKSAPNTPGFPGFSSYPPKSPFYAAQEINPHSAAEHDEFQPQTTQYASPRSPTRPTPSFQLQAPPIRVQQPTPAMAQQEFAPPPSAPSVSSPSQSPSPPPKNAPQHVVTAAAENDYGSVPIPHAY